MKVLIVDDHPLFRFAVKLILQRNEMDVVGEVGDGATAVAMTRTLQPDLVILDLGIPNMGGLQVLQHLKVLEPCPRILVLTSQPGDSFAVRCAQAGAQGFVSKDEDLTDLEEALKAIRAGRLYFSADVLTSSRRAQSRGLTGSIGQLSDREITVLQGLARGWDNKRIAEDLLLSNKTVSTYKIRLLRKLNVDNVVDLLDVARQHSLL